MAQAVSGFRIRIVGSEEARRRMDEVSAKLYEAAHEVCSISAVRLRGRIIRNIESTFGFTKSRVPRPKTNRLSRAVRAWSETGPGGARVVAGVAALAPYARIQEFGGRTAAHFIAAKNKLSLRWIAPEFVGPIQLTKRGKPTRTGNAGAFRFAKWVLHPGSEIPARPYFRPAVEVEKDRFAGDLRARFSTILRSP